MPRRVIGGLIQAGVPLTDPAVPIDKIRQAAIDVHVPLIEEAGRRGVQILGLQEVFNGPYFCPSQDAHWYDIAEPVPGPTTDLMAQYARKFQMAMEIVFNPSATVAGLSQYLWKLEQPAHAVANGYFMACSNRVGEEAPWKIGRFYGSSYFVDPHGHFLAVGSEDKSELVVAEMDLDMIEEVRRVWQFYRDRRPESYRPMAEQLP